MLFVDDSLAFKIDEKELFPFVVLTMTSIFGIDECCDEYCDLEFVGENGWESITLKDEDEDDKDENEDDSVDFDDLFDFDENDGESSLFYIRHI